MWLFFVLLFGIAAVLTLMKLSLFEQKRYGFIAIVVTCLLPILFYSYAVRMNTQHLVQFVNEYTNLSNICTLLIFESILLLLFSSQIIDTHYKNKKLNINILFCLLPSIGFLIGICALLVYLFNQINGYSFALITIVYVIGLFVGLTAGFFGMPFILPWISRLECMLTFSFLQLVAAMFLPIIVLGLSTPENVMQPDILATIMSGICFIIFICVGIYKFKHNINLLRFFKITA